MVTKARVGIALLLAAVAALVTLTLLRLPYGIDFTDESFYVAMPYAFALGNRPFVDELTLQQTAAILITPLVKARIEVSGTEGLMLFVRRAWFAVALLASLTAFLTLKRKSGVPAALVAAAVPVGFIPFALPSLSYNAMGALLLTIGLLLGAASLTAARPWPFVALLGLTLTLASVAYPPLAIAAIAAFAIVGAVFVKRRNTQGVVSVLVAIVFAAIAALAFVFTFTPAAIAKSIEYVRAFGVHGKGVEKFATLFQALFDDWPAPVPLRIVMGVAGIAAALLPARWRGFAAGALLAAAALYPMDIWSEPMRAVVAAVVLLLIASFREAIRTRPELLVVLIPSLLAGIATAWTSSNGIPNAVVGLMAALVVTMALLATDAVSIAGALIFLFALQATGWRYVYRDHPIRELRTMVASGPFAGLRTTPSRANFLARITAHVKRRPAGASTIVFYDEFPAGYLLSPLRPNAPSVWIPRQAAYPGFDRNLLGQFYDSRPSPDVVVEFHSLDLGPDDNHKFHAYADPFRTFLRKRGMRTVVERPDYSIHHACPSCDFHWIEAEALPPPTKLDYGSAAELGWTTYATKASAGRAAITRRRGAALEARIPNFRPGTYEVDLSVYSYGPDQTNDFSITLGDSTRKGRFGERCEDGFHRAINVRFEDVASDRFVLRADAIGQSALIVDSIAFRRGVPRGMPFESMSCVDLGPPTFTPELLEAESFAPIDHGADYATSALRGWASYEASYSGGRAAATRLAGATMRRRMTAERGRSYEVKLTVFNFNEAANELEVSVGGVARRVRWGGPGSKPGIITLPPLRFDRIVSTEIVARARTIGQSYMVVDAFEVQRVR